MRLFHPRVDLNAPKGEGEIEYTPLQLTRLRFSAINFQRIVIGALVLMLCGGGVAAWAAWRGDQRILDQRTDARQRECLRDNTQSDRAVDYARDQAIVLVNAAKASGRGQNTAVNDAYIADAAAAARRLFPRRSCTPEAIEAYYETRP